MTLTIDEERVVTTACTKFERDFRSKLENKKKAKQKRLDKGYKTNLVTSSELKKVILHWLVNGRGVLRKSMIYVYDTTGKTHKEVDWVTAILSAKHFGRELTKAFESITDNTDIAILKGSKIFDKKRLIANETLSRRIKKMDTELKYEETLIENERLEEEVTRLKAALVKSKPWQEVVMELLDQGYTQANAAKEVGKSLSTIKRLITNLKGE